MNHFKQIEQWIKEGKVSFDQLYSLIGMAYSKEAADDAKQ